MPSASPGIPSDPVSLHGFLYWDYTGNSDQLKSHLSWRAAAAISSSFPARHPSGFAHAAPVRQTWWATEKTLHLRKTVSSRGAVSSYHWAKAAAHCQRQGQGLMPSPALPPPHSSIPLPPGIYLHLPTPGLLPPLLHRFGCKRIQPTSTRKKKGCSLFSRGLRIWSVRKHKHQRSSRKQWHSKHYWKQKQENINKVDHTVLKVPNWVLGIVGENKLY